jgi:hypothetical protein
MNYKSLSKSEFTSPARPGANYAAIYNQNSNDLHLPSVIEEKSAGGVGNRRI